MKKGLIIAGVLIAIIIVAVVIVQGTGDTQTSTASQNTQIDYNTFEYDANGVGIKLGANFNTVYSDLGEENEYFEAESCAFEGIDKIYYYSGFEVRTYPLESEDYVLNVILNDDTVNTPEGVYIGMDIDTAISMQGEDYKNEGSKYEYTKGSSTLVFIEKDGLVASITYTFDSGLI